MALRTQLGSAFLVHDAAPSLVISLCATFNVALAAELCLICRCSAVRCGPKNWVFARRVYVLSISSPGPVFRRHFYPVLSALLDCYACDRVHYPAVSLAGPHHFPPSWIMKKSLLRSRSPSTDFATTHFPPLLEHLLSRRMDAPWPSHDRARSLGPLHTQSLPQCTALDACRHPHSQTCLARPPRVLSSNSILSRPPVRIRADPLWPLRPLP
ncbi:hypothetical protein OH77DRAFT_1023182 [Trametes cingulata]|nr:hypothetical protein OH77DRAFT_1023182 [Trametes cingulata]